MMLVLWMGLSLAVAPPAEVAAEDASSADTVPTDMVTADAPAEFSPVDAGPVDGLPVDIGDEPAASVVPDGYFRRLVELDIQATNATNVGAEPSAVKATRREPPSSRSAALGEFNTITAPDDFSAAVQTDLEGVEGGAVLSPLALIPKVPWFLHGIHGLGASLKDNGARWGAGFSILLPPQRPLSLTDLPGVEPCALDEDALRMSATVLEADFHRVCEAFVAPTIAGSDDTKKQEYQEACGFNESDDALTAVAAIKWIADLAKEVEGGKHGDDAAMALGSVRDSFERLEAFEVERGLDCWTDKKKHGELQQAVRRYEWSTFRYRVGFRYTQDHQTRQWGFNPKPDTPLADGSWRVRRAALEANLEYARLMVTLSGGYYAAQVPITDDTVVAKGMELGGAVSFVLGALDGGRLVGGGGLRAPEGKLPPHIALGATVRTVLFLDKPASQADGLNEVEVIPYLDLIATDKLRFRVGAPVRAKTVLREADPDNAVSESRALQWSVSPLIFTVLKL